MWILSFIFLYFSQIKLPKLSITWLSTGVFFQDKIFGFSYIIYLVPFPLHYLFSLSLKGVRISEFLPLYQKAEYNK